MVELEFEEEFVQRPSEQGESQQQTQPTSGLPKSNPGHIGERLYLTMLTHKTAIIFR